MLSDPRTYLLLEHAPISQTKTFMPNLYGAVAINHEAARHSMDRKSLREHTLGVEDHAKLRRMLAQEPLGVSAVPVNIDCDDRKALRSERLLQMVHEGEGRQTRGAPGGPEIEIHNVTFESGQIN